MRGAGFLLLDWEVIGQQGEEASTIHVACAKSQKTGHTIRTHSRFTWNRYRWLHTVVKGACAHR